MKKKTKPYLVVLFIIGILIVTGWVMKEGIKDGRKVNVNNQN